MIYYKSTRGTDTKKYTFSQAILKGLALDGGLLIPEKIPFLPLKRIKQLKGKTYQEVALEIFKTFETDLPVNSLKACIEKAYSENFDHSEIAPVAKLKDGLYLIELWHGPTAAFKDMALQIMPELFTLALKKQKLKEKYLIVAATSGDTGKAALEGYKDQKQTSVVVFYPKGKVSKLQEKQMVTQVGKNLKVLAVEGDFDKAQKLVKQLFDALIFNKELLEKYNVNLSSANSINWGRLIPQIVYYFTSYLRLVKNEEIKFGQAVNFAVPTGNFGNILAAFLAKKMGLPVNKLICATNANSAASQFLKSGVYDVAGKKIKATISPAMDILISSNVERLAYFLTGDSKKTSLWMGQLKETGRFSVDKKTLKIMKEIFYADYVSDEDCLDIIKVFFTQNKYLFDPHTSVGIGVANRFRKLVDNTNPILICSTAHWSKFPEAICRSLGLEQNKDQFKLMERILSLDNVSPIPECMNKLKNLQARYRKTIKPDLKSAEQEIFEFVRTWLGTN